MRWAVGLALLFAFQAFGQSVKVTVDRTTMGLGETLRLRILLQGRFDDVRGPEMPDFDVVGKSTSTSISVIGGALQQEQRYDLTLMPRRAGRLRIGPVEVLAGGRVVAASQPVTVEVLERGVVPKKPSPAPEERTAEEGIERPAEEAEAADEGAAGPERYAGQLAFLWVRRPDRTLYVGEPVVIEYVLYVRSNVPVQGVRVEKAPELKGFVVDQAQVSGDQGKRVKVRGMWYDTYVQWRGALTALGPGQAAVDSMAVVLMAGDIFTQRRYRVVSEPVVLTFHETPAAGRPADFVPGTVGTFVVQAALDKNAIRVGESAILSITVSGSGNLRAIRAPSVEIGDGLRVSRVPSSDLDEKVVGVGGVTGRRVFQYLLTAEREGEYEIPRIEIAFFNPVKEAYERARSEPLRVVVSGVTGVGPIREVKAPSPRIVEIIPSMEVTGATTANLLQMPDLGVLAGTLLGPLGFLLGCEAYVRYRGWKRKNEGALRRERALKEAEKVLRRLTKAEGMEQRAFWAQIEGVIREFLRDRFGVSVELPQQELKQALTALGVADDAVDELLAELEACAFGRFVPTRAMDEDRQKAIERVRGCLRRLDRVQEG